MVIIICSRRLREFPSKWSLVKEKREQKILICPPPKMLSGWLRLDHKVTVRPL